MNSKTKKLKMYNTLTKRIEELEPIKDSLFRIYSCGPTIYNFAHIGNLRYFIFVDVLRKTLKHFGYKVKHVMNLTDVDDKTIKSSQEKGIPLRKFTDIYAKYFFEDLKSLNIEPVEFYPRATETINEMIPFIEKIIENGHAYVKNGNVYFDISTFKDYGKLANLDLSNLKENAQGRLDDEYDKDDPRDFALWKAHVPEDGDVFWESPWGKGRPGWHIECSVMSSKYLTDVFKDGKLNPELFETIDIHTGAVDLIFPHHTNEIAQTESVVNKPFVKYWIHCEHLFVDGKKMSKSLGNFYTLRDLIKKGYSPRAFRYVCVSSHYKQQLNFTLKTLDAAENTIKRLDNFVFILNVIKNRSKEKSVREELVEKIEEFKQAFDEFLSEDLDTPKAVAKMFEFINYVNKIKDLTSGEADLILDTLKYFDSVLSIFEFNIKEEPLPQDIMQLILEREEARKNKNWELADKIREQLKEQGIELADTPLGTVWRKIR
ncbi:MAG: cysteinyl-tRNA synthetase [Candidatus Woesearchaeota archaeon]|nr:cysteinyl-tRNA synthetase [Candidatus Woesearchaeota archaeon]